MAGESLMYRAPRDGHDGMRVWFDSIEKTDTALGGVAVELLEVARPPQSVCSRRTKTQERVWWPLSSTIHTITSFDQIN